MTENGKGVMAAGVCLALLGALLWGLGRVGFRGLPGDFRYEADNVRVYFPIVSCLVLSALVSAAMWLWNWYSRR